MSYFVYILKCADDTLYTGIAKDISRRLNEHEDSKLGAKYTRGRGPFEVVYTAEFVDRSAASKEEYRIKSLTRKQKLSLISQKI